jgi:nitroimidazol reductase NimA-like FMN-containing flavoprotein (pyridoxamine 5'-phosphate oxidase superfamily)
VMKSKPRPSWASVIASGRYQELPEPQYAEERAHARNLLDKRHQWAERAGGAPGEITRCLDCATLLPHSD